MEPLRIGVSARLLYPDPSRVFLPTKSVQYLEQSVANWIMSGDTLAFMIPEMSLATPHAPQSLKVKNYVDALDGLLLQGGADMSPKSYGEAPINPMWAGDEVRDAYEIELFQEFVITGCCHMPRVRPTRSGSDMMNASPVRLVGRKWLAPHVTLPEGPCGDPQFRL